MEELKTLIGKPVRIWTYFAKKNQKEKLVRFVGIVKKVDQNTIVLQDFDTEKAGLWLKIDKIMCIREWETNYWKRISSPEGKMLWGNPKLFSRRGHELIDRRRAISFMNGVFFTLGMMLVAISLVSIISIAKGLLPAIQEIGPLNSSFVNQTAANLIMNFSNKIGSSGIQVPVDPTGIGVSTNLLSPYGWHYLTILWSTVAKLLAYVLLILPGFFLMFGELPHDLFEDQYYEMNLRDYKDMRFEDEVK